MRSFLYHLFLPFIFYSIWPNIVLSNDKKEIGQIPIFLQWDYIDKATISLTFSQKCKNNTLISIGEPLHSGESKKISFTAIGNNGLKNTVSFEIYPFNNNLPKFLINEFSTAGTKKSPDRIELLILEDGYLNGVTVCYDKNKIFTFSDNIAVKQGQYFVFEPQEGLPKNNGRITIYKTPSLFSPIIDEVIYSSPNKSSLGEKYWIGETIDSTGTTSSRTFCRKTIKNKTPANTKTKDDWYICDTKCSSFGKQNSSSVYNKESDK